MKATLHLTYSILAGSVLSLSAMAACGGDDNAPAGAPSPETDAGGDVVDMDGGADVSADVTDASTNADGTDTSVPRWDAGAPEPTTVRELWAGGSMNCACIEQADAGAIACWGSNFNGDLGRGATSQSEWAPVPVTVMDTTHVTQVRNSLYGNNRTCVLIDDGTVQCWGASFDGSVSLQPKSIPLTNVVDLGIGSDFSCARLTNGHVACLGRNASGQLGLGATDYTIHAEPAEISPTSPSINWRSSCTTRVPSSPERCGAGARTPERRSRSPRPRSPALRRSRSLA